MGHSAACEKYRGQTGRMNDYPIDLNVAVAWIRSRGDLLADTGVKLVDVKDQQEGTPTARGDFDSDYAVGRIIIRMTGEADFEVLRMSDGGPIFFRHEHAVTLEDTVPGDAFKEFVKSMMVPNNGA